MPPPPGSFWAPGRHKTKDNTKYKSECTDKSMYRAQVKKDVQDVQRRLAK